MVELGDCLVGCERRDHRDWFEAVAVVGERVRVVDVQCARERLAQLCLELVNDDEAGRRVQEHEIETELVETVIEEPRQRGRHTVERVPRGISRAPHRGQARTSG
jgi:hypothetical protein